MEVYQLAEKLADLIWEIVVKWDYFQKRTIEAQMVEAADSVPANIAEGSGRYNHKDNCRFIKIARGSLYETKNWLRRAYRRELLTNEEIKTIKPIIEELLPKLNGYFRSIKNLAK